MSSALRRLPAAGPPVRILAAPSTELAAPSSPDPSNPSDASSASPGIAGGLGDPAFATGPPARRHHTPRTTLPQAQAPRKHRRSLRALALAFGAATLLLGMVGPAGPPPAAAGEATAAVAMNFLLPLRSLAAGFEAHTGHTLRIVAGSTGQLYAQITNGAPYDLFLSADAARPRRLEEAGLTVPGSRRTYALGRIALWSAEPGRVSAGGADALRSLGRSKIAIADPAVAPYGVAAQETLEHLGFWEPFQDRLVRGINVAQVFQFIGSHNAGMGFIAQSQLAARPKDAQGSVWLVPAQLHGPIEQDLVLLERAEENEAAHAFFDFIAAPDALRRIESFGYSAPAE